MSAMSAMLMYITDSRYEISLVLWDRRVYCLHLADHYIVIIRFTVSRFTVSSDLSQINADYNEPNASFDLPERVIRNTVHKPFPPIGTANRMMTV